VSTADPDVVCILPLGNNDCADDAGLAAAPARMTALLETLRAYTNGRGVKPRIVACYLFGHGNDTAKNARHDSLNTSLAATVWPAQIALGQSITICDPRPFIKVPLQCGMRSDYTHPTDAGYRRLADCYFPAICNAIGIDAQWGRSSS
jgi:lysophospholipase L1-like esterase